MGRPKQRTPELRERVLAEAVELLAREGVGGFTTRAVALAADTSTPAVYELFGDKGGLVRAVFFEGFRRLRSELATLPQTADARADLLALVAVYRRFISEHRTLAEVMLSRPFSEFEAGQSDLQASGSVREFIIARVRRWLEGRQLGGDATDIAHALVALTQGLAAAESTKRLGTTRASVDRRWALAVNALLDGLETPLR